MSQSLPWALAQFYWWCIPSIVRLKLGSNVRFSRTVVKESDRTARENAGHEAQALIAEFRKSKTAGDRAGMKFWRKVAVYSFVSEAFPKDRIWIIDE